MKLRRLYPCLLLAAGMALLLSNTVRAEEDSSTIGFTDPSKPGTLKVRIGHGDIRVHGEDVNLITVTSDSKRSGAVRKDGLRVVTESSSFVLNESGNVATLEYGTKGWDGGNGEFNVTVPRNTSIVIANSWGGDVKIADITGDIDVRSLNGEVRLDNVKGGVSVETMNGEIHASVTEFHADKALTFTSMNGEVVLRVPEASKANVSFRTHNGTILTDFDEKALVTVTENSRAKATPKPAHGDDDDSKDADWHAEVGDSIRDAVRQSAEAAREGAEAAREAAQAIRDSVSVDGGTIRIRPMPPLPPVTGGKTVTGTLNGGGPAIQVATMNGDITLRKLATSK